ncbi:glycosyltransferase family 2 protein [Photobacterium leiognathi]|uniref:glycosyltransferase family 2 protein n=1 Tax=Photobacterium leiognathi TaxID=553611 RepID=UPI00076A3907|nr:glycosyltransferase family A protein [Photobacterium leiognathi]
MLKDDLISIIMPVFNASETILSSINSVLAQSYDNFELIICDDNSTDDSLELIKTIQDNRLIITDNKYSKGASGSRNSCIDVSSGRYIAFIDSDDVWAENKLLVQLNFMKMNKCVFSYGNYRTFKYDINNIIGGFNPPDEVCYSDIIKRCDIGCLTVMIDRYFYNDFRIVDSPKEDYATWVYLLKNKKTKAMKYPGDLAFYRLSDNSLSSNKFKEISKQYFVLKHIAKLSGVSLFYCLFTYIFNGIYKSMYAYRLKKEI